MFTGNQFAQAILTEQYKDNPELAENLYKHRNNLLDQWIEIKKRPRDVAQYPDEHRWGYAVLCMENGIRTPQEAAALIKALNVDKDLLRQEYDEEFVELHRPGIGGWGEL